VSQVLENEITACCKRLKLSRNLADMAQTTEGGSHQEYLYKLLSAELANREKVRVSKLINSAGFYSIKTFDGFRFDEITLPSDLTPERLKSLDFIRQKKNIIGLLTQYTYKVRLCGSTTFPLYGSLLINLPVSGI
jgi:DNA replication protein DnaC